MHHHLSSSSQTCHWGYFDARLSPVLTIADGDRVTVDMVSGGPEAQAGLPHGCTILPEMAEIHAHLARGEGPHILTGPIAVAGTRPGDVVEVTIEQVSLRQDWGYTLFREGAGTLPERFQHPRLVQLPIDIKDKTAHPPWGGTIPLAPFPGVIGLAPPVASGRLNSVMPGVFGGNLDNKLLVAGAVLSLPVQVEGALLSIGDGHAVQGDGEVSLTALETALSVRLKVSVHHGPAPRLPLIRTPSHLVTMGLARDLDTCMQMALETMMAEIETRTGLGPEDSYMLCSLAADFRVTQNVNRIKGIHAMLPWTVLPPTRAGV